MATGDLAVVQVEISAPDASVDALDRMTRQLLAELRETEVESAELAHGNSLPAGAKAVDPVTVGSIAMTVLPAALPKLIDFVQAWATRGNGRTVKFKGKIGKNEIDFEGPPEALQSVLSGLGGGKRK